MPTALPVKRTELAARPEITDWALRHRYITAARGVVVPRPDHYDPAAFDGFGLDAVTRAWANHLKHPGAVLGGWSAVAVYGLRPDWADHAPVVLLSGTHSRGSLTSATAARYPLRPVFLPLPDDLETCTPCPRFPTMKVVTPGLAAAQCLSTILDGRHTWWVHDVPGLTRREVRAVQFIDAFAQCTWVSRREILGAAKGLVNRKRLRKLLALADDGAQSPMETVTRLLVRDLLPAPYRWESQIRVDLDPGAATGWTRQTLPDLGVHGLKIAIYYDGAYHDDDHRTDVDFDQFHTLRDLGWEVLRFNRKTIRDPRKVRELVSNAIARAISQTINQANSQTINQAISQAQSEG
ncbi:DUF559 domain-containing protein [Corynebacterium terpenotabidum]|uniref:DUF559 domain-containing protein n=1 Tax=Corynebacterium terpenotabidum TaxID=89154 RepID=UPI0003F5DBC5|nr:DUF559 domain-containing protein [Corynebacterium terpenotabidum]